MSVAAVVVGEALAPLKPCLRDVSALTPHGLMNCRHPDSTQNNEKAALQSNEKANTLTQWKADILTQWKTDNQTQ